jgi:delta 1-pyrroline-5-carboxylate dehydrogenase
VGGKVPVMLLTENNSCAMVRSAFHFLHYYAKPERIYWNENEEQAVELRSTNVI